VNVGDAVEVQVVGYGWCLGKVVNDETITRDRLPRRILTVRHARGEYRVAAPPPSDMKRWKWPGLRRVGAAQQ